MRSLPYRPYADVGDAHVIVDGSARDGTVLTLSHWPHAGTPAALAADLSAEIVFKYLDTPALHVDAVAVSNNHFDQDGLAGVYTLANVDDALHRRERLVDIARAGDFGKFVDRSSAPIAFAIAELGAQVDGDPYPEMLERLPELIDHPERFRKYWDAEDAHLSASEAAIASGEVGIEEIPDVDLAVVRVPDDLPALRAHRFSRTSSQVVHHMAVHNATERLRLLYVQGHRYEFQYLYETWIQYASRRPMPRVELNPLARHLTELEASRGTWTFSGAGDIAPVLSLQGAEESSVSPEQFLELLVTELRTAEVGWDPYG